MIGDHIKNLDEIEKYLRDAGETAMAENVVTAKWFLWDTWDELLKATIGVTNESAN